MGKVVVKITLVVLCNERIMLWVWRAHSLSWWVCMSTHSFLRGFLAWGVTHCFFHTFLPAVNHCCCSPLFYEPYEPYTSNLQSIWVPPLSCIIPIQPLTSKTCQNNPSMYTNVLSRWWMTAWDKSRKRLRDLHFQVLKTLKKKQNLLCHLAAAFTSPSNTTHDGCGDVTFHNT